MREGQEGAKGGVKQNPLTDEQQAPHAAAKVELRGLQRIVKLEHGGQVVATNEGPGGAHATDDGRPGLHHGAAGSDGSETAQHAVAHISHVPAALQEERAAKGRGSELSYNQVSASVALPWDSKTLRLWLNHIQPEFRRLTQGRCKKGRGDLTTELLPIQGEKGVRP